MVKFLGLLLAVAIGFIARSVWKRRAKERLAAIDNGEICVACGSKEVTRTNNDVTCHACGDERDLAALRNEKLTDEELSSLYSGEDRGFWS